MGRRWFSIAGCAATAAILATTGVISVPANAHGNSQVELDKLSRSHAGTQERVATPTPLELAQEPLVALATRIRGLGLDGYSNVKVSPEEKRITLYWRGSLPKVVDDLLAEGRANGVKVDVRAANYTYDELDEAADAIADEANGRRMRWSVILVNQDGSGLTVQAPASTLNSIRGLNSIRAGKVPVKFESHPGVTSMLRRYADEAPYWGGSAYYVTALDAICSTGFSIRDATARTYILTAAHCYLTRPLPGHEAWTLDPRVGVIRQHIGNVGIAFKDVDAGTITTSAAGRIYTRGIDPNYSSIAVGDATDGVQGTIVRSSGAMSGERGSVRIENANTRWQFDGPDNTVWTVSGQMAQQTGGSSAGGQGDSGGPIYSVRSDGRASAKGTLSAGDPLTAARCSGIETWWWGDVRRCFIRIYFPKIRSQLSAGGWTIITSS